MAPETARGPTEGRRGVVLSYSGCDDLGRSWSLGGPIAEAATCGAEEALQRRTRRTAVGGRAIVWARWGITIQDRGSGYVSVVWAVGHRRGDQWRR